MATLAPASKVAAWSWATTAFAKGLDRLRHRRPRILLFNPLRLLRHHLCHSLRHCRLCYLRRHQRRRHRQAALPTPRMILAFSWKVLPQPVSSSPATAPISTIFNVASPINAPSPAPHAPRGSFVTLPSLGLQSEGSLPVVTSSPHTARTPRSAQSSDTGAQRRAGAVTALARRHPPRRSRQRATPLSNWCSSSTPPVRCGRGWTR